MHQRFYTLPAILSLILALSACDRSENEPGAETTDPNSIVEKPVEEESPEEVKEDRGLDELERVARTLRLTGDLDEILERGYIRVLVPFSRTFFFYEGARPRGVAYEFMEEFARTLRKSHGKKLIVYYLPTLRNRLIQGVAEGLGDIAIAGLTATDERKQLVDFVVNSSYPVREVIVTGPEAPRLESLQDLTGHRVFVRLDSSYYESLRDLSARLRSEGKAGIEIIEADEHLETDDILELVSGGVEQITVADDYLARFWETNMNGLAVREDLVVREAGLLGPAVRKDSPQLVDALFSFQKTHGLGTLFGNILLKRYFQDNPWVRNPEATVHHERFEKTLPLFRRYAGQYGFDELLLLAQGYQESRLDQSTRSRSGAVGVMQIKPATAAGDPVNITDVNGKLDNNIHAGVKYLRHLVDDYFDDPEITPFNRHVFAIAAYNAGPTRIQSLRRKAKAQGLDPNIWFNNVELVSAKAVGRENVDYVRNVLKYWVAFRLANDFDPPDT